MQVKPSLIGVVVPAHQAAATVGPCLEAVLAAGVPARRIVVVDDGSRDRTGAIARGYGVEVLRHETPQRPARARNAGVAALASGVCDAASQRGEPAPDVVLFVDADVTIHADAVDRVSARLDAEPDLAAVFGAYDTAPPAPAAVSRYRNLLHAHVHRRAHPRAETFWTGIGAVRRARFEALGGLDPAWEDIEDVEFGLRLRAAGGRIRCDPAIQGTHLKAWTLRSMWRTDLWGRAVPWTRLLRAGAARSGTLNTARGHKLAAAAVALMAPSLALWPFWGPAGLGLAAGLALFLGANARFLGFLWRVGGPVLALRAVPYHAVHYAAALTGYALVHLTERPRSHPAAGAGGETEGGAGTRAAAGRDA